MNKQEVVEAISALASGVHPATGDVFAEHSPYNHLQVIRALFGSLEREELLNRIDDEILELAQKRIEVNGKEKQGVS